MQNQTSTGHPEQLLALFSQAGEAIHALPTWAWIAVALVFIAWIITKGTRRVRTV